MKDIFDNNTSKLKNKKLYLLDMDGTIYLGNKLFDCTIPFLKRIKDKGGKYFFITNNSSKSVTDYVNKLHRLGITDANETEFFTSAMAASLMLKEKHKDELVYVQGTRSFVEGLINDGIKVTEEISDPNIKVVLVGFDLEINMDKLTKTCKLLTERKGIPFYATNPDWVCPTEWGYVPDCGSMCFSIEKATGRTPIYIGKPEPTMVDLVRKNNGYTKDETVVIGDRLYTDIRSGNRAGVDTICVLSGEVTLKEVEESKDDFRPTYCLNDLSEIEF